MLSRKTPRAGVIVRDFNMVLPFPPLRSATIDQRSLWNSLIFLAKIWVEIEKRRKRILENRSLQKCPANIRPERRMRGLQPKSEIVLDYTHHELAEVSGESMRHETLAELRHHFFLARLFSRRDCRADVSVETLRHSRVPPLCCQILSGMPGD